MKLTVWQKVFILIGVVDVVTVGIPLLGLYFGSADGQARALSFMLGCGWIVGIVNWALFSVYIVLKRPRQLKLIASLFALAVSIYYVVTLLTT